jgi:hypothetical protein
MSKVKTVEVTIIRNGSLCVIPVPFDPEATFGKVRAPVNVTVNGYTFRSTICRMHDNTFVPFRKSNREPARIHGGERVKVRFAADTEKRTVEPPTDLAQALKKRPGQISRNNRIEQEMTVKKIFAILSVALVVYGGATMRAQAADAASAEKTQEMDDAAMMAAPGVVTPESLAATMRYTRDAAASLQGVNNQLSASPEVEARVRARYRAELPAQYPDIEDVLDLSLDQVNKLFDLLTEQNANARRDATAGASARVREDRLRAEDAQLSGLLGTRFPRWQEYRKGLPSRLQVRDLGAALIAYDLDLSDAKSEALMAALIAVQAQVGQSGGPYTEEGQRILLDAASGQLSAEQLDVYKKVLERQAGRARALAPAKE